MRLSARMRWRRKDVSEDGEGGAEELLGVQGVEEISKERFFCIQGLS